jgi:hypothetical protein
MPVAMTSPGFNVACRLTNAIMFATLKFISAVDECCFRSPLTQQLIRRFCGSGMSSAVTRNGPRGKKPSSIFPATHWLVASCAPRAVRSLGGVISAFSVRRTIAPDAIRAHTNCLISKNAISGLPRLYNWPQSLKSWDREYRRRPAAVVQPVGSGGGGRAVRLSLDAQLRRHR